MDSLNVMLNGIKLKNPLIAASGVVGYGEEIEKFLPISTFGAFAVKGTTKQKKQGKNSNIRSIIKGNRCKRKNIYAK